MDTREAGRLGGKTVGKGVGAAKRRGDSEHYRALAAKRTRRAQLTAVAVEVTCPACGEDQPAPKGSLYWTQEDLAGAETLTCCSCDAKLVVGVSLEDTLRVR